MLDITLVARNEHEVDFRDVSNLIAKFETFRRLQKRIEDEKQNIVE